MSQEKEKEFDQWDVEIHPSRGLFDLKLKQVWKYRDLLFLFVRRDFVSFYKQTALGPIWFFIQPIFTTFIYVFIFSNLAGIPTDGIPQPIFYLSGIIAWSYFSDCLIKTSNVFRENASIFGKVYFPRLIMPLSIIISSLVKFSIQLVLLACMILYYVLFQEYNFSPTIYLLLFPILLIFMAVLGLGFGMLVSSMTTKYRDLGLLVSFALPLFMYATPVVYPLSTLSGNLKTAIFLNPMTPVIEGIRKGLFGAGEFDIYSFIYLMLISAIILVAGVLIFNKVEKDFVDTV
ncbi:ABC transporter permease [Pedobacter flavus]|uniref:Transport permease protein n=1 Tax=Pedobacter flavus TaxID=3113906 RepID=A0ABU7H038_9SPHI|nr:ABC transporter permease [Pedobacter sp. VNH31]MEE1884698.1 ABC transporter permease [Pedobacter sp. VNH31]